MKVVDYDDLWRAMAEFMFSMATTKGRPQTLARLGCRHFWGIDAASPRVAVCAYCAKARLVEVPR